MANPDLTITDNAVKRKVSVGTTTQTDERELFGFYEQLSDVAHFDTGLLPVWGTGMLSLRHAGDRTQFVFQYEPGIYYIIWGEYEGSSASEYHVAMPYRIVIGDHVDGQLRGARHFYSPVPITSIDQPLYHCNVPNLNCRGYGGNGVGWICLYHREDYSGLTFAQKMFKTLERASGHEAFNDANMSGTDGARFYQEHRPDKSFLYEPKAWAKKSQKEGFEWTLDEDLWIPILVKGIDNQEAHDPNGVPLTLEMAMLGNYAAYYPNSSNGETELSLMNQIRRDDKRKPTQPQINMIFQGAFAKSAKKAKRAPRKSSQSEQASAVSS